MRVTTRGPVEGLYDYNGPHANVEVHGETLEKISHSFLYFL